MPNAIIDVPFPDFIAEIFTPHVTFVPWSVLDGTEEERNAVDAIVSFTHEHIGLAEVDRLPTSAPSQARGRWSPYVTVRPLLDGEMGLEDDLE